MKFPTLKPAPTNAYNLSDFDTASAVLEDDQLRDLHALLLDETHSAESLMGSQWEFEFADSTRETSEMMLTVSELVQILKESLCVLTVAGFNEIEIELDGECRLVRLFGKF